MSDEDTVIASAHTTPRQQIVWSDRIKSHHTHLRERFEALSHTVNSAVPSSDTNSNEHAGTDGDNTDPGRGVPGVDEPVSAASEELRRWQATLQLPGEAALREAYASAMHDLATLSWAAPPSAADDETAPCVVEDATPKHGASDSASGRKRARAGDAEAAAKRLNDRILFCIDCLSAYFLGRPTDPSDTAYAESLPTLFSRDIKPLRQSFYHTHKRIANTEDIDQMIDTMAQTERRDCPAWQRAMRYRELTRAGACDVAHPVGEAVAARTETAVTPPPLRVLDVGSCYGPFVGRTATHPHLGPVPLAVTSVDLAPYRAPAFREGGHNRDAHGPRQYSAPDVLQADWLSTPFYDATSAAVAHHADHARWVDDDAALVTPDKDGGYHLAGLRVGAYDAVFFCLLLSYMPSPRLRYRACLQAFLALEEDGLLVILSTRTQGSRRRPWTDEWITTLATIGFERVHKSVRGKIVGLSFARHASGRPPVYLAAAGGGGGAHDSRECGAWTSLEDQLQCAAGRRVWMEAMLASHTAETGLTITADGTAGL